MTKSVNEAYLELMNLIGSSEKQAFAPAPDPAAMGGGMPPMDPAMAGGGMPPMPPMDPSMMMDPAMAGGGMPPMPPMDPAMAGGAMPPMTADPAMDPALAPPPQPAAPSGDDLKSTIKEVLEEMGIKPKGEGGDGKKGLEAKVDMIMERLNIQTPDESTDGSSNNEQPPAEQADSVASMGEASPIPTGGISAPPMGGPGADAMPKMASAPSAQESLMNMINLLSQG